MEAALIVLGILALAALGACVWLAGLRAGAAADASAARAEAGAASAELGRARADADAIRTRADDATAETSRLRVETATLREQMAGAAETFRAEREALELRHRDLEKKHDELNRRASDQFKALAGEALSATSRDFLKLAEEKFKQQHQAGAHDLDLRRRAVEELVRPIGDTLKKTDERLGQIEKQRESTFAALSEQVRAAGQASEQLRAETGRLVTALRRPQVRGRYGEVQLRRVAEVAGMRAYCDFGVQETVRDWDGRALRPDMTVKLPNDRVVVIDAKTNIEPYLDALEAPSPAEADAALDRFAAAVAEQVGKLSAKSYWDQFEKSPEFVVMFVPGDQFIDAALSRRPELFEDAAAKRVILASPSTLIGLLRAVELGWKEQRLAEEARELRRLGEELHERAAKVWELAGDVGASLGRTVEKYNQFVASLEGRLEPTLRKFEESGVRSARELPSPEEVVVLPRAMHLFDGRAG